MPETTNVIFSYKEVVEALVKKGDIHEGVWGLFIRFGLGASNIAESGSLMRPAAIIPVMEIGLQKFETETNMSVDAAKVNPQMNLPEVKDNPDKPH